MAVERRVVNKPQIIIDAGMTYWEGRRVFSMVSGMMDLIASVSVMGGKYQAQSKIVDLQSIARSE